MEISLICMIAYGLDRLLADPYHWPHPVIAMGHYIAKFLQFSQYQQKSVEQKKRLGLALLLSAILLTALVTSLLLWISQQLFGIWGYWIVSVYLVYTCFSVEGLAREATKVRMALQAKGIVTARKQLSMIVGRDTNQLEREDIIAAVVETVAENTTDGFVAPLFYVLLFGPVGGMVYKVVNTLDSMVGYRYEPYKDIGYFSAKCDDLLNWVPARICRLMMWGAAWCLNYDWQNAIKISLRDARNHLSPNSGYSEAAVAGALTIQLGGTHTYAGVTVTKPTIGDPIRPIVENDIEKTNRMLYVASLICLIGLSLARAIVSIN